METSIVRNQFIISLRNGMIAYVIADKIEDIAVALQNNKFFNTKEQMMINTADIVAIMSPHEWCNQQKYQRGWYKSHRGTKWYNKKGEYEEETDLGRKFNNASDAIDSAIKLGEKENAQNILQKIRTSEALSLIKDIRAEKIAELEKLAEESLLGSTTEVLVGDEVKR